MTDMYQEYIAAVGIKAQNGLFVEFSGWYKFCRSNLAVEGG